MIKIDNKRNSDKLLEILTNKITLINNDLEEIITTHEKRADTPRLRAWGYSALAEAAVYGWMATKNFRYLNIVANLLNNYFLCTDSKLGFIDKKRNIKVNGWGTWIDDGLIAEISNVGTILYPLSLLIQVSKDDLDVQDLCIKLSVRSIPVIEEFVKEKKVINNHTFYVSPIDGKIEPWNHVHQFAAALLSIGDLHSIQKYITIGRDLLNTFMSLVVVEENETYSWAYRPILDLDKDIENDDKYKKNRLSRHCRPEQIWKGITTLKLPLIAYMTGNLSKNEILKMSNIFTRNICLDKNNYEFNTYISDRSIRILDRQNIRTVSRRRRVQALSHWMILSPFNLEIATIINNTIRIRKDLFPKGWFGHNRSLIGYAVNLYINSYYHKEFM
jgi:hypothetical protein